MPNGHMMFFLKDLPKEEMLTVTQAYWKVVEDTANKRQFHYIGQAFLCWSLPVLIIYGLGLSVGWVYRGFKKQKNKEQTMKMNWKEFLGKIRIVDIKKNIRADQAGNINVKIENNTYNYNNVDPDALSKFLDSQFDEKAEIVIKKETFERLKSIDSTLKWLTDSTMAEVVSGTTLSTAIDFVTEPLTKKPSEDK